MDTTSTRASVSLAVFATTIAVSSGEYLAKAGLGEPNEWVPVALTTLGIAAATATAVIARAGSPWAGLSLGLLLAWAPFASVGIVHALSWGAFFMATAGLFVRARPGVVSTIAASVFLVASLNYCRSQSPPTRPVASPDLPDVVLLVMDTTRRDHLSVYGYDEPTTPQLERFAEHARVYDDAWSVAPWTSPSHASMFSGLLPPSTVSTALSRSRSPKAFRPCHVCYPMPATAPLVFPATRTCSHRAGSAVSTFTFRRSIKKTIRSSAYSTTF